MKGKLCLMTLLVSVFMLFSSLSVYAGEERGVTDKTIKVGIVGDLTGPIATVWIPVADALKNYIRHVNEQGGVNGRKIMSVFEDDRYSIPLALSAFKKLVFHDHVLLLMAASGVGHTHAIIPLSEKNKMPTIAQTNDKKYFFPARRYIFTAIPFYEDQLELIFEYIFKDLKANDPTIALAFPDTGSGNISRDSCRKLAKVYDVKKYIETVITTGAGDFSSQILSLKRLKPDYVIIHGYVGSTSSFLRDAHKLRFKSNFIAIQYACVDDTVKVAGVAAQGLIGTNCFPSWNDTSPGIVELRDVTRQYHPKGKKQNRNYIQGWFVSMLIHNGLKNAGRNLNKETVVEGFERIRELDTKGICGIVAYGPDDHKPIDYSKFYKADVEKEQFIPITDWRKPTARK